MVGSSRNSSSGLPTRAIADVQPPLLAPGQLEHPGVALVLEADQVDHLVHRPRVRVEGGVHGDRLAHREVPVDARGLQHDPDAALQRGPVTAGIDAKNADLAAVTSPVALENLHRGGLARPVRAEQREDLAWADRKVDAPDSLHARVGLLQAMNIHRERARLADLNRARVMAIRIHVSCGRHRSIGGPAYLAQRHPAVTSTLVNFGSR